MPDMTFTMTMPADLDPAESEYEVTFHYTPAGKPNGHTHPHDPDTPSSACIEDIRVDFHDAGLPWPLRWRDYPAIESVLEDACWGEIERLQWEGEH